MNLDRMASILEAIIADEVGIERGGYGKYWLRSTCQPVFERAGETLRPVAVEGAISPYLAGQPRPLPDFFAVLPPQDRNFIEQMGRILQLRNHRNVGVDGLRLYIGCDLPADAEPGGVAAEIGFMAGQLDDVGLDPQSVICTVGEAGMHGVALAELVMELRSHGFGVAIDDFGAGAWTEEQLDLLRPEVFRIDGEWFGKICREATTVRLFEAVMLQLRMRAAKVLVSGIDDRAKFEVALRAGADFFQGSHLAAPALVGTVFDETPIAIADKLGQTKKIIPLFG
jgi:EAL domain-containing protein (putative c-di-GMP-specific phosphodiesterase class I)